MDDRDLTTQLRGAVHRRDGTAVVALADDPARPSSVLQLLGEGLAAAVTQRVDGAQQTAAQCVAALRARGWVGDVELADQLDALAGIGPIPMRRPLAVDLEQLSDILEGDPMTTGGALDLRTGEVWPRSTIEYVDEGGDDIEAPDFEDGKRFLWVHGGGSRDGYQDMVLFLDTVEDEDRADRLGIALQGRGAFRRFRNVLARWPGELERWHQFSGDRQRGRARAWLADAGYRVASD
ncbi:MAG: hypothetical protein QOI75_6843 [Pseudonocardiales bacterium]|nr:hypothetical protein [Pseudonocardiales bacterium]